jgi:ABC-2 type transport system permease protein
MASMLRGGYATMLRNWMINLRVYRWSFFLGNLIESVLTVLMAFFIYHVLAGSRIGQDFIAGAGTADYMSFLILGTAVLNFSVSLMLGISRSLITERREGTLESLLLAPARRLEYFAGVGIQWTLNSLGETLVMLLVAWPFGLSLSHINLLTLLMALPVALIGLFGMSAVLGAVMLATGDTYISQNTLFAAMTLLCGFLFPASYLPLPLQWLGDALPASGALRLLRGATLNGMTPATALPETLIYLLLGVLYAAAGLLLMRRAERRAMEGVY